MDVIPKKVMDEIIRDQKFAVNAYYIYMSLCKLLDHQHNTKILRSIAKSKMKQYRILRHHSKRKISKNRMKIYLIILLTRILGITFTLKLLERKEEKAHAGYKNMAEIMPDLIEALDEQKQHENLLLEMTDEKQLYYMGSVVLGLNDALVELTGALAGYTFAIQNSRKIAILGVITGFSAALSMAASEYLSKRQDENKNVLRSSVTTGVAYLVTVILLILPFLILKNPFINLGITVSIAIIIILIFNFYISIAKGYNFKKRFLEMSGISIGVAVLSFAIGWGIKRFIGFDA